MKVCASISSFFFLVHDFKDVWSKLLSDQATLATYSSAMSSLATGCWERDGEASRIAWCVKVCKEYGGPEGALRKLLLKDLRRKSHSMPTVVPQALLPGTVVDVEQEVWNDTQILRLLDVGSCYNPFLNHKQFEVTAIDIAPARQVRKWVFQSTVVILESSLIRVSGSVIFYRLQSVTRQLLCLPHHWLHSPSHHQLTLIPN